MRALFPLRFILYGHLIILLVALLIIVVCACSIYIHYRYALPLRRLLKDIQAVRHSEILAPLPAQRGDEIGRVAQEFNRLFCAWKYIRYSLEQAQGHWEKKVSDRTAKLRTALHRLEKAAHTDQLTGLANRKYFLDYLHFLFQHCCKNHTDLACLMIDLDNFKALNDRFGHSIGDEVIAFMGEILRASIRQGDLAGRYGGDEFVLILPDTSAKQAFIIAERIRLTFAREAARFVPEVHQSEFRDLYSLQEPSVALTMHLSIGIATLKKNNPSHPEHLLQLSDQALYRAKQNGRNTVAAC